MKKIVLIICTLISLNSFASTCKSSHLTMALKKSDQRFFGLAHNQSIFLGSTWGPLGVGFLSVGAPAIIATGAGVFFLVKGIKGAIQEPRYELVTKMLAIDSDKDYSILNRNILFKRLLRKANKIRPYLTREELVNKFIDGIVSGEFCKKSGKPFTFQKMKRRIFKAL